MQIIESNNETSNNETLNKETNSYNKEKEIKTVKQISIEIKNLLENAYEGIWIRGELSNIKVHSSGHKYFALKEEDYVINAICWKNTPFSSELKEGMIIDCYAELKTYSARSSYQIRVIEAREVNKQGDIFAKLEELKQKLTKEGLFALENKRPIPKFPESIAILTSPTGAVLHDIIHRITARYPCCFVYIFPVPVQGADSEKKILEALNKVELMADKIYTVILARGGGSLEDLWVFNSEAIVRKVASLKIPIITAIGHETDTTLVDYASDLRAPTPTAAAEIAVPDKIDIQIRLKTTTSNALNIIFEKIEQFNAFLKNYSDYHYIYINAINNFEQKIDNFVQTFINNIQESIATKKYELGTLEPRKELLTRFENKIEQYVSNILLNINMRVENANITCEHILQFLTEKETEIKEKIIIYDDNNNRIISSQEALKLAELTLKFYDGDIIAVPKCKKIM